MAKTIEERIRDLEGWFALGTMIVEYGLPAVLKILQTLDAETATTEDILKLRDRLPIDEPFFENDGDQP